HTLILGIAHDSLCASPTSRRGLSVRTGGPERRRHRLAGAVPPVAAAGDRGRPALPGEPARAGDYEREVRRRRRDWIRAGVPAAFVRKPGRQFPAERVGPRLLGWAEGALVRSPRLQRAGADPGPKARWMAVDALRPGRAAFGGDPPRAG